jgi:hypothetical protein
MTTNQAKIAPTHFKAVTQASIPRGRHGKHRQFVSTILADLDRLKNGSALKVPLAELSDMKARIRSALHRASRKAGRIVATASDAKFLYVWEVKQ